MQDREAICKAASLMGVRPYRVGSSPYSLRGIWRVTATGGRIMEVFEILRPFLTKTKIRQAERAIEAARRTGFVTMAEMRERQKRLILRDLKSHPGLSTRLVAQSRRICYSYALGYLEELKEGKFVWDMTAGTPRRPRKLWFAKV